MDLPEQQYAAHDAAFFLPLDIEQEAAGNQPFIPVTLMKACESSPRPVLSSNCSIS